MYTHNAACIFGLGNYFLRRYRGIVSAARGQISSRPGGGGHARMKGFVSLQILSCHRVHSLLRICVKFYKVFRISSTAAQYFAGSCVQSVPEGARDLLVLNQGPNKIACKNILYVFVKPRSSTVVISVQYKTRFVVPTLLSSRGIWRAPLKKAGEVVPDT